MGLFVSGYTHDDIRIVTTGGDAVCMQGSQWLALRDEIARLRQELAAARAALEELREDHRRVTEEKEHASIARDRAESRVKELLVVERLAAKAAGGAE